MAALSTAWTGKYIPKLFSRKMISVFYAMTVFTMIANADYEGEIKKQGDTVFIRTMPDITIDDHAPHDNLATPQTITAGGVELAIDKAKRWNFIIDDIEEGQSDIKDWHNRLADHAAKTMKVKIDAAVLAAIYLDVDAANKGATAGAESASYNLGATGAALALTEANVIEMITDCASTLDEANVPRDENRWMVLPTWVGGLIKRSQLTNAAYSGDSKSMLRNGYIGDIDGFKILLSNQVKKVTDGGNCWNAIFGCKDALTFATQIERSEKLRGESKMGTISRGVQVFGYKVVDGKKMGLVYIRRG